MRTLPAYIGLTLTLLAGCASTSRRTAADDTPLTRARARLPQLNVCNLPNVAEPVLCGTLQRRESPLLPDSRMIPIFVVVIPALAADPQPDPLVEVAGGPGLASTDYARHYVTGGSTFAYRRDRDILLMDARGMGRSNALYCEELALHRISSLFPRFPADAAVSCRDKLSATADLTAYSTENTADDLEAVRSWLGYSKLNFLSYSYGTRSVLTFMRMHPSSVRSAILWGVVPPDYKRPLYYARDSQVAMDRLLADCLADPACRGAFPNVRDDLQTTLERLDEQPVPITVKHPATGAPLHTAITRAGFAQALFVALEYPDAAHKLPLIFHHAARGDYAPFLQLDVASEPPRRQYNNAAHLSIVCPEEVLHVDRDDVESQHRGTFMPADRAREYLRACELWQVPALPASTLDAVRSDAPTLIVSGWMDPFTPPELGDRVARTLPNARHVVVRHLSHEPNGLKGVECLDEIFLAFLKQPEPASLDTTCTENISPPPFVTTFSAEK